MVVESHSPPLVAAAAELSRAVSSSTLVPIEVATAVDDDTMQTGAEVVASALRAADRGAGVLVLTDMGSAVQAAGRALDLIDDADLRRRVTVSPGPLVEGLVAAVAAAGAGGTLHEVAAQAADALSSKQAQLGAPVPGGEVPARPDAEPQCRTGSFTVGLLHGLHARPAGVLVQTIAGLDAEVWVRNLTAGGESAAAVDRVLALAARGFEEHPG